MRHSPLSTFHSQLLYCPFRAAMVVICNYFTDILLFFLLNHARADIKIKNKNFTE
ncbi:MAG: hypothetical protein LBE12_16110 [Planctomycetaceae bacterium]|nr:hypothetical protein [Planctomycetaceae bacterium]